MNAWEGIVSYAIFFLINAGIYAVFTLGLNVQWGYTGLFNVGIAGFSMIGAYTSALLTTPASDRHLGGLGLPIPFGIAGAALAAGLLALLIGWITLRLRDDYLAIATLGIAEVLRLVIKNEGWFGGGVQGISDIPRPLQGLFDAHYNAIFLIVLLGLIALLYWAVEQAIRSPWGRVLRAIREDEIATAAAGKDTVRFRMEALVFGACLMGIGGALYAHFIGYLSPDAFEPMNATFLVWAMLIVGGSGNNRGALLGALVVWAIWSLTEFFTDFLPAAIGTQAAAVRIVLIGLLLIIMLIWRPQGLLGEERQVSRWVAERLQRDRAHEG
ncbi:MAG TPA: branched-chain amino acid ABC transporter permease [Limnochordia bacterium]